MPLFEDVVVPENNKRGSWPKGLSADVSSLLIGLSNAASNRTDALKPREMVSTTRVTGLSAVKRTQQLSTEIFCGTSLPLASTKWDRLTLSSLCPLAFKQSH